MAGRIPMGQKELLRSKMLEMVKQGQTTLKAATITMRISYRQGIRLYKAYLEKGNAALIHGNAGKASNRQTAVLPMKRGKRRLRPTAANIRILVRPLRSRNCPKLRG